MAKNQKLYAKNYILRRYNGLHDICLAPMNSEVDIWGPIMNGLKDGKQSSCLYIKQCNIYMWLFKIYKKMLLKENYIREPKEEWGIIAKRNRFDLVPLCGFSPDGYRLGRGKGYYDKMLVEAQELNAAFVLNADLDGMS